jgi:Fe-S cluster assembly protein SufD
MGKRLATADRPAEFELVGGGEIEVPAGGHAYQVSIGNYTFHLRHPDSYLFLRGLIRARDDEVPELTIRVIHHSPRTQAETVVKTLASDRSRPRFMGLIRIEPGAIGCESYLNHDSLLLGDHAASWTVPSLEILADEVKCSHAATVRTITNDDLFYLRARGLSRTEAEEMLVTAFLA